MDLNNQSQSDIQKAKANLPKESREAIESVPWHDIIFEIKKERNYNFSQIEKLGNYTDLLLCGLLNPIEYPALLERDLGITREETDELVDELNERIFKKIREELARKQQSIQEYLPDHGEDIDTKQEDIESREDILKAIENHKPEIYKFSSTNNNQEVKTNIPIASQKLAGSFGIPAKETTHSINNDTTKVIPVSIINTPKKEYEGKDPYKEPLE